MPQYLELLFIPVTAGIVGYATNALAIRMLFRPFKPHWYTLGWQGIIPRTRGVLASSVAKVVGERLVTIDEINKALASPELIEKISSSIQAGLTNIQSGENRQILNEKITAFIDDIAGPLIHTALYDPRIASSIDSAAAAALTKALNHFADIPLKDLEKYLRPVASAANNSEIRNGISRGIEDLIRNAIQQTVNSGKSINQLLSGNIDPKGISNYIVSLISPMLDSLFSNPDVADALSEVLVKYKNDQFGEKVSDRMKLGAVNMFFYDDKIRELVHEKLPDLGKQITTDTTIQKNIRSIIELKVLEIINRPLNILAEDIGMKKYYAFLHIAPAFIARRVLPEKIGEYLLSLLNKQNSSPGETLNDIIKKNGTSVEEFIPKQIGLSTMIAGSNLEELLKKGVTVLFSAANTLSGNTMGWLSSQCTQKVLLMLYSLMPGFLKLIKVTELVEEKINTLDMIEVENMLFAFMKDHFKWINILGFILGFILGLGQMAFLIVNGTPVP